MLKTIKVPMNRIEITHSAIKIFTLFFVAPTYPMMPMQITTEEETIKDIGSHETKFFSIKESCLNQDREIVRYKKTIPS